MNLTVRQRWIGNRFSEDANYRETIRGVRSFMGWHQIPDFDSASSSLDDNPFAGSRVKPTGKVSVKLPVDERLCWKFERLNVTVAEGYPPRNTETGGLLCDQFVKPPRSSKWYDMHTDKKDSVSTTVCDWSPELAKLNSTFSRVARRSLPSALASRTFSQDTLRQWERAFREQSVMCNQAAGLSRCLTKVQDSMVTQLKTLCVDKTKGKAAERTQQAVEELEYLVTFNWSISQAMQRTMQDLSGGVFISMANLTLARRDSYLEFIRGGVKPDTLTALRTTPGHLHSLFPDSLLVKGEEEISRSEERRFAGHSHRKPGPFHPYASSSGRSTLCRLPVRPQGGQGQTHTRALADLNRQDIVNPVQSGVPGTAVHVPHRTSNSHRKASPPRSTSYETHTVALEEQLEGTRITRKGDTRPQVAPPPLKVGAGGSNVLPGQPLHPLKHPLQIFTDASKEGWGAHLNECTARGTWSIPESKLHINHLHLNAVFLVQDLCSNNLVLVATDNTTVVAYINKEEGMKSPCVPYCGESCPGAPGNR